MSEAGAHEGAVSAVAPAKINLFLHITGRRAAHAPHAGYHELESLFAFTRHGDRVSVAPSTEFRFEVTGAFADALKAAGGDGDGNLVVRAAKALAAKTGRPLDGAITLEKNLPVAAGIGGGSSDAAAALVALNRFWGLGLDQAALAAIALTLGADVPACLNRSPVMVRGIGEDITPVRLGYSPAVLLVNPGAALATPDVFRAYHEAGGGYDAPREDIAVLLSCPQALAADSHNSLEAAAAGLCGEIEPLLDALIATEGAHLARLSGSGATCFALYDTVAAAEAAEARIRGRFPACWTLVDLISQ